MDSLILSGTKLDQSKISVLEQILESAPFKVDYKSNSEGLYLDNEVISLRYVREPKTKIAHIDLWFLQTEPKIGLITTEFCIEKLPDTLICDFIFAHKGDLEEFTPADTLGTYRTQKYTTGKLEWFEHGTGILIKAALKYRLAEWYKVHTGQIKEGKITDSVITPQHWKPFPFSLIY